MGTAKRRNPIKKGENEGTQAQEANAPIDPRLLDLRGTAKYLSVSEWTVRELEVGGILCRVRVPLPNNGELRKLLFDVQDLNRLIEGWKESAIKIT